MTQRLLALFVLSLAGTAAMAATLSYEQAKTMADHDEAGLSAASARTLMDAQRDAGAMILQTCSVPAMNTLPFTVVMQLDGSGKVVHTWRHGESTIAACFEREMASRTFPVPDKAPFYTAFDMAWTR